METDRDISVKKAIYSTAEESLTQLPSWRLASPVAPLDTFPANAG